MRRPRQWKFLVGGYYNETVQPPKVFGDQAIEVGLMSRDAADLELAVLQGRPDIGEAYLIGVEER